MPPEADARRPGEATFNAVLVVFSLFLLWQAYGIDEVLSLSSAGAFPVAMAAIMVVTAGLAFVRAIARRSPDGGLARVRTEVLPPVIVVFSVFILGYSLLLEPLGFLLASFLFLVVSTWFLEAGRFRRAVLLSTLAIVGVYLVFRVIFQVVLPEGLIPERSLLSNLGQLLGGGR